MKLDNSWGNISHLRGFLPFVSLYQNCQKYPQTYKVRITQTILTAHFGSVFRSYRTATIRPSLQQLLCSKFIVWSAVEVDKFVPKLVYALMAPIHLLICFSVRTSWIIQLVPLQDPHVHGSNWRCPISANFNEPTARNAASTHTHACLLHGCRSAVRPPAPQPGYCWVEIRVNVSPALRSLDARQLSLGETTKWTGTAHWTTMGSQF